MTEQEIAAMKLNIERQLEEYEQAINAAVAWFEDWKARRPKGFRNLKRQPSR